MRTRTVGELQVLQPDLDSEPLAPVDDAPDDDLRDSSADHREWPGWELLAGRLDGCAFRAITAPNARWRNPTLLGCVLDRVDLSAAELTGATFERCRLTGCRFTGARLREVTLKNVVVEDCRFDYAILDRIRATGPVAFTGCVLANAALSDCRLPTTVVSDCRLSEVELAGCDLRGTDLRGSPLVGVRGLTSLRGSILEPAQLADLATVAARDLGITVRDPA